MVLLKRDTFATGFLTAAVLWLAWWMFVNFRFQGGHIEDSPSGKNSLMVFAPLDESVAGTYIVTLTEKATGNALRSATIKLNSKEKTKSLRGLPVSMNWDSRLGSDAGFGIQVPIVSLVFNGNGW